MVQVRRQSYRGSDGSVDVANWLAQLPLRSPLEQRDEERLRAAVALLADAATRPGRDLEDWARQANCEWAGVETAQILAELRVGIDCLLAGILYRAVREERLSLEEVAGVVGEPVARLLRGVLRMAAIADLRNPSDSVVLGQGEAQRDNIRKMLVAMVDDVRVALIKLAERTCAIRAVKVDGERRELIARDVFDVYAPWPTAWVSVI